jgi:hypothetical protein
MAMGFQRRAHIRKHIFFKSESDTLRHAVFVIKSPNCRPRWTKISLLEEADIKWEEVC